MNQSGHELTGNSSGDTRPPSSQLAEPLWTDLGLRSGISVHNLSPLKRKKKKAQAGNELSIILLKSSHPKKSHLHHSFLSKTNNAVSQRVGDKNLYQPRSQRLRRIHCHLNQLALFYTPPPQTWTVYMTPNSSPYCQTGYSA